MKDEVKEYVTPTLEYLKECVEDDIIFETSNCKALLDYITNLQEELNELKEAELEYHELLYKSLKFISNLQKENKKSNNIINELEKHLVAMSKIYEEEYKDIDISAHYKSMLDKVEELKEGKENE